VMVVAGLAAVVTAAMGAYKMARVVPFLLTRLSWKDNDDRQSTCSQWVADRGICCHCLLAAFRSFLRKIWRV